MTSTGGFPLSSAMRVVHWIHGNTPNVGFAPQPPISPCFANADILVFQISHLPDSGLAAERNHADFTGRQLDLRVPTFFGHDLGMLTGASHHLSTMPHTQFDIVDCGAQRDVGKG